MNINIGDRIRWRSAAGCLTGTVTKIKLAPNAAKQTIPWMLVEDVENWIGMSESNVMLPGTDNYFAMMKLNVIGNMDDIWQRDEEYANG
jgi:hypothetical protein